MTGYISLLIATYRHNALSIKSENASNGVRVAFYSYFLLYTATSTSDFQFAGIKNREAGAETNTRERIVAETAEMIPHRPRFGGLQGYSDM
jgi:hypothetical protein